MNTLHVRATEMTENWAVWHLAWAGQGQEAINLIASQDTVMQAAILKTPGAFESLGHNGCAASLIKLLRKQPIIEQQQILQLPGVLLAVDPYIEVVIEIVVNFSAEDQLRFILAPGNAAAITGRGLKLRRWLLGFIKRQDSNTQIRILNADGVYFGLARGSLADELFMLVKVLPIKDCVGILEKPYAVSNLVMWSAGTAHDMIGFVKTCAAEDKVRVLSSLEAMSALLQKDRHNVLSLMRKLDPHMLKRLVEAPGVAADLEKYGEGHFTDMIAGSKA